MCKGVPISRESFSKITNNLTGPPASWVVTMGPAETLDTPYTHQYLYIEHIWSNVQYIQEVVTHFI